MKNTNILLKILLVGALIVAGYQQYLFNVSISESVVDTNERINKLHSSEKRVYRKIPESPENPREVNPRKITSPAGSDEGEKKKLGLDEKSKNDRFRSEGYD